MTTNRKLQGEIDRTLKKVTEGLDIFNEIWDKVYSAANQTQKEKYEGDLKKEIKKLQRLREQIKTWLTSNEIKDKSQLLETRRQIEAKMEQFKVCEKETKTKAYSKEGLLQKPKVDPSEIAKNEVRAWIGSCLETLKLQIDDFECEIEKNNQAKKKSGGKGAVAQLQASVLRNKKHLENLETILRLLENDEISHEEVNEIKDSVEYYIEGNQDPDFVEDELIYESILGEDSRYMQKLREDEIEAAENSDDKELSSPSSTSSNGEITKQITSSNGTITTVNNSLNSTVATVPSGSSSTTPVLQPIQSPNLQPQQTTAKKDTKDTKATNAATTNGVSAPVNTVPSANGNSPTLSTPPVTPKKQKAAKQQTVVSTAAVTQQTKVQPQAKEQPKKGQAQAQTQQKGSGGSNTQQQVKTGGTVTTAPKTNPNANIIHAGPTTATTSTITGRNIPPSNKAPSANIINLVNQSQQKPSSTVQGTAVPNSQQQSTEKTTTNTTTQQAVSTSQVHADAPTTPQADLDNNDEIIKNLLNKTNEEEKQRTKTQQPNMSDITQSLKKESDLPRKRTDSTTSNVSTRTEEDDRMNDETFGDSVEITDQGLGMSTLADIASHTNMYQSQLTQQQTPNNIPAHHLQPSQFQTSKSPGAEGQDDQSNSALSMLDVSWKNAPLLHDTERAKPYIPQRPVQTPASYPQTPELIFNDPAVFEKFDTDTLFFIFYYQQGTYQQYLAARELKKQSWRFHKKYLTWFQRHDQPKLTTDDYEQGTYVYFDYETGWCQRIKSEFPFEYCYLEDELPV